MRQRSRPEFVFVLFTILFCFLALKKILIVCFGDLNLLK